MIEQRRRARRTDVNADAAADNQRLGMVHVDVLAANEADRKGLKRSSFLIGLQRLSKCSAVMPEFLPCGRLRAQEPSSVTRH